jgi:hypothetical protein
MRAIKKRVVVDEANQPVAVQIDYADWLEMERELALKKEEPPVVDLSPFVGTVVWPEDAVEYQRRIRDEWD